MEKSSKTTLILFGTCSFIWTVRAVFEGIDKLFIEHPVHFALDVLCAVLWIFCFFFDLKKVKKEKSE